MDIFIMNLLLLVAIIVIGYYIVDAFLSLYRYQSDAVTRVRHKRALYRALSVINGTKTKDKIFKTIKRCVNE